MTLVGNIKDLGFAVGSSKVLKFTLINSMGKKIYAQSEDMNIPIFHEKKTIYCDTYGDFSIDVIPNETIKKKSFYTLEIDEITFTLFIPKGTSKLNIICILTQVDYDEIAKLHDLSTGMVYEFDRSFADKFEKYIIHENQNLTRAEEKLCEKFVALVELPEDEKSLDILQLDKYLGGL